MSLLFAAKGLGLATSAFIFIPAGRDIVDYTKCLLPGEDTTRPLMTASSPKARTFMWGVWGLNHCALSFLKVVSILDDDKPLLKFLAFTAAVTFAYLFKEKDPIAEAGGDVNGFIVVCGLQTLSLGYLAFA